MNEVVSIFKYFPRAKKLKAIGLLALMLFAAVLEIAGVVSVMPFLAILGSPELIEKYYVLSVLYSYTGASSFQQFCFSLAGMSFAAITLSAIFKLFVHYRVHMFSQEVSGWLSTVLFDAYLCQPYDYFLKRNSSEMTQNVLAETSTAVAHVVLPVCLMCAYSLLLVLLFGGLLFINPTVSITILAFFVCLYGLFSVIVTPLLRRFGAKTFEYNERRFRICGEALNGIKTVKARGLESVYAERFLLPSMLYARYQAYAQAMQFAPRHLVEVFGVGAVMMVALYFLSEKKELGSILSMLGVYVLAGSRLLPAAQQIYQSFAQIRYGMPSLRAVLRDMPLLDAKRISEEPFPGTGTLRPSSIELVDVRFRYRDSQKDILRGVSFTILANITVGIVGSSGSGKTTLGDILLGLLRPIGGTILIDGVQQDLFSSRAWKRAVGYVSQDVYLSDASIAENIAFGVPYQEIERGELEKAARMANIYDFVMNECPDGFDTQVGEKGVRLSGGQKQRIGIARALYGDPQVLIFDEATSALDLETERTIVEAIDRLSHRKTIIMIAHRMQTIKRADQIVFLDKGEVAGIGSFDELITHTAGFRKIATYE